MGYRCLTHTLVERYAAQQAHHRRHLLFKLRGVKAGSRLIVALSEATAIPGGLRTRCSSGAVDFLRQRCPNNLDDILGIDAAAWHDENPLPGLPNQSRQNRN